MRSKCFSILFMLLLAFPGMKGECKSKHHPHKVEKFRQKNPIDVSPNEQAKRVLLRNKDHLSLLNYLILQRGYKSYLEIGIDDGANFRAIQIDHKVGVDPSPVGSPDYKMTSDEFFAINQETFDIIFIDGLHLAEQVLEDTENSLACLNKGGVIVLHDCMPSCEKEQTRNIEPGAAWTGDVWKAAAYIRMNYEDANFCVIDMDYGCGILTPDSTNELYPALDIEDLEWKDFVAHKKELLNIVSLENWLTSTP